MLTFNDYEEVSKRIGIGGDFFKLKNGENKLRLLSAPEHVSVHFVDKSVDCLGQECQLCGKKKPSHRILVHILDRADGRVKEAELPWSVYTGLGKLSQSSDYGFSDLPSYDINIIRKGEALDTEYTVLTTPNSTPLTPDQLDQLSKMPKLSDVIERRRKEALSYRQ